LYVARYDPSFCAANATVTLSALSSGGIPRLASIGLFHRPLPASFGISARNFRRWSTIRSASMVCPSFSPWRQPVHQTAMTQTQGEVRTGRTPDFAYSAGNDFAPLAAIWTVSRRTGQEVRERPGGDLRKQEQAGTRSGKQLRRQQIDVNSDIDRSGGQRISVGRSRKSPRAERQLP
jgi:hypothetical protein